MKIEIIHFLNLDTI